MDTLAEEEELVRLKDIRIADLETDLAASVATNATLEASRLAAVREASELQFRGASDEWRWHVTPDHVPTTPWRFDKYKDGRADDLSLWDLTLTKYTGYTGAGTGQYGILADVTFNPEIISYTGCGSSSTRTVTPVSGLQPFDNLQFRYPPPTTIRPDVTAYRVDVTVNDGGLDPEDIYLTPVRTGCTIFDAGFGGTEVGQLAFDDDAERHGHSRKTFFVFAEWVYTDVTPTFQFKIEGIDNNNACMVVIRQARASDIKGQDPAPTGYSNASLDDWMLMDANANSSSVQAVKACYPP